MAETVKVFKNTGGTPIVPSDFDAAVDYTLHTTSSSENAVIKDVQFLVNGDGVSRINPVLTLNGTPVRSATGGSLEVDTNLIMGPSSTLKIEFDPNAGPSQTYFKGMFFTEGSSGIQFLEGDGETAASISPTQFTSSSNPCDDATAAMGSDGSLYYYKVYGNNIYKYDEAAAQANSALSNWSYGSTGYSITTDGEEYLYRGHGSSSNNYIYRTKFDGSDGTTLSLNQNYGGPTGNQGAGFHYYKDPVSGTGFIFSKHNGPDDKLYRINLSTLDVTTYSNSSYHTGSYCDGGFVTTNTAGVAYVVEAGDGYWFYHNIATGVVTRTSQGTSTSTEYAQGGAEIAPGIGLIFGESSDRATLIDMNTSPPTYTTDSGSHGYTTDYAYGNKFGFAGYLHQPPKEYEYKAYVSGIEIT